MTTEIINNGLRDVTVLKADKANNKVLVRIGYEEDYLGEEIYLGKSYYIGGVKLETPHDDVPSDFTEVDAPEDYYTEPDISEEPEISDAEALQIITEG